jgi:hypothetical protein
MDRNRPSTWRVIMPMFMTFISLVLAMDYGRILLDGDTSARKIFAFVVWTAMVFVWGRIARARLKARRGAGAS